MSAVQPEEQAEGPSNLNLEPYPKCYYKPWSATPSGNQFSNPRVKDRLNEITLEEKRLLKAGHNNPDLFSVAPMVNVAFYMRRTASSVWSQEAQHEMLYPEVLVPEEMLEKDEIGLASQEELLYIMSKKGMKSKELAKITHPYGGERLKHVSSMKNETMGLLHDLKTMSGALSSNNAAELEESDFVYAKSLESVQLMEDILRDGDSFKEVKILDRPEDSYYRVAARDWTAPEARGEQKIVMLKRKIRLGKIGDTELIMRTSFIVNLDENISSIDKDVLKKVKRLKYDEEWIGKVVSPEIGLVDEIGRLGLEDDPNSFVLISSTIYAKNDIVEAELAKKREKDNEEARLSFKALQAKLFHSPR